MKRILIVYYTQSGQLLSILQSLAKPLISAGHTIHFEEIQPQEKFPFPWSSYQFFNAFPEVFSQQPQPLKSLSQKATNGYDLIILGYQPWFLTPSRPVSSFLQSEAGKQILNGKPVITILGCRNMWLGAQEKVKKRLKEAGAKLIGHIALIDRSPNLTSLITILRWMFTGDKKPFWIFPAAGVSEHDIEHSQIYGEIINAAIEKDEFETLQKKLNDSGAIDIKPNLVLLERRGQKAFSVWSKFIASGGPLHSTGRKIRVYIFMYLLPTAIFFLSPLLWIVSRILLTINRKQLIQDVEYYKQNSLRNS
jgi:flavodoxin